jgi:hypothetical protein
MQQQHAAIRSLDPRFSGGTRGSVGEDSRNYSAGCTGTVRKIASTGLRRSSLTSTPSSSMFLDEAKPTYEQALGRLGTGDFAAAKEFAEAS